ncbi:MAG: PASTA domain-containing protein [Actinobacteria bacterium]|nr:PASTA domain-containing protein [Actinomycetota bacterium]
MNLQAAQNKIQENGVFYSDSFDATGEGRMQINDSNWIVVSQTPSAGSPITEGSANLGAVKEGEPNPC